MQARASLPDRAGASLSTHAPKVRRGGGDRKVSNTINFMLGICMRGRGSESEMCEFVRNFDKININYQNYFV